MPPLISCHTIYIQSTIDPSHIPTLPNLILQEFYDSMFTFIDVWVDGLEEAAYVEYAEKMCLPLMNELGKGIGLTVSICLWWYGC